jgi:AcrR family transcriptional regulator
MARTTNNTAERLVDVAEKHFAERGYEAASLNDISAEVGIRTPSLYSHFRSKQALYEAVFDRRLEPLFTLLEREGIFPAEEDQGRMLFHRVMDHLVKHPNLARLIQHAVLAGGKPFDVLMDRVYRPLFALTNAALVDQPKAVAQRRCLVFTSFHSLMFGYITFGPVYTELLGQDVLSPDIATAQSQLLESLIGKLGV